MLVCFRFRPSLATPAQAPTIQLHEQLKFRYPLRQGQAGVDLILDIDLKLREQPSVAGEVLIL